MSLFFFTTQMPAKPSQSIFQPAILIPNHQTAALDSNSTHFAEESHGVRVACVGSLGEVVVRPLVSKEEQKICVC